MASRVERRIYEYGSIRVMAHQCKRLGVPLAECAIRRLVKQGDIPAVHIGNKAVLSWENVVAFIKNGARSKPQESPQRMAMRATRFAG